MENQKQFDDEIDLFDLMLKIWKWKWITAALMIVSVLSVLIYYKVVKNDLPLYSSKAVIKIGRIMDTPVDPHPLETFVMLGDNFAVASNVKMSSSGVAVAADGRSGDLSLAFSGEKNNSAFSVKSDSVSGNIILESTSSDKNNATDTLNYFSSTIVKEYEEIFKKGVAKLESNVNLLKSRGGSSGVPVYADPKYNLETYTFPYMILQKPAEAQLVAVDNKVTMKLALAAVASLFMGVFISLFVEYIMSEIKKRKEA